jgi:predicted RNA-binding Zn-ribbon protein involved in translation (DUF1610 family)
MTITPQSSKTDTLKIPVYFCCLECGLLYLANQRRQHNPGHYDCRHCGYTVHSWQERYDFTEWLRA